MFLYKGRNTGPKIVQLSEGQQQAIKICFTLQKLKVQEEDAMIPSGFTNVY